MSNQKNQNTEEQQVSSESFGHTLDSPDQEQIDARIAILSQIHREDDPEFYSVAQLNIGLTYKDLGNLETAINVWSRIRREDNPEIYSVAQLNIGLTYKDLGILEDAIIACSNIRHGDNPEIYAGAQLNLGLIYKDIGDLKTATIAWSNIHYEDNPEAYAGAQLCFGMVYQCEGNLENAIAAWSNVRRKDSSTTYAQSQLNIGLAYKELGNLDSAITAWSNVHRNDDPEIYADTQLNLGTAYAESGKLDKAITAWSKITRDDDPKTYAWAQLNLGTAYAESGKLDKAITAWSKITRDDDPKTYAQAQFNIGNTYSRYQGKLDHQAIEAWSNITRDDDPKTYAQAQFNIGKIYEDEGDLERAKEAYYNAQDFSYYNYQRVTRILECPPTLINDLHNLAKNTDEVRKSLQIIPDFESKVSHYSRAATAFTLFGDERNDQNPSNFRLSTIRGVNDPTEGLVLGKYWAQQGISETIHTNDAITFISCFTFNHDSLNQFRLYGKENGQEATGVSLVFKKEFFSDQADILDFIADPSTDPSSKSKQIKPNETGKPESDNKKPLIGKSTLYRCIYLDPETGYWTLAQRDKSTFYREHNENEDTDAKEKWEDYYELISEIEGCVETHLFNEENNEEEDVEKHLLNKENNDDNSVSNENNKIKSISQILNSIFTDKKHSYNKCNKNEKQKILEAIRFILLPLQYLVKHIAFQEEQECRIMYTTHLHDEKIHHDWKTQEMYVEYEEHVLPHIDKIYLSPGSAKYQDFFRILLDQKEDDEPDKKRRRE